MAFANALRALNAIKADGIVLVVLPGRQGDLISLDPVQHEHILVEGLPIQLVPAPSGLAQEAIISACPP